MSRKHVSSSATTGPRSVRPPISAIIAIKSSRLRDRFFTNHLLRMGVVGRGIRRRAIKVAAESSHSVENLSNRSQLATKIVNVENATLPFNPFHRRATKHSNAPPASLPNRRSNLPPRGKSVEIFPLVCGSRVILAATYRRKKTSSCRMKKTRRSLAFGSSQRHRMKLMLEARPAWTTGCKWLTRRRISRLPAPRPPAQWRPGV